MGSRNLKMFTKQSIFFLTAVFIFLFFGWQALAAECNYPPDWNGQGSCGATMVYRDTGGSGLAECKYRVVTNIAGEDTGWLSESCSGNQAIITLNLTINTNGAGGADGFITIVSPTHTSTLSFNSGTGAATITGQATDNAGNESDVSSPKSLNIQLNNPPDISSVSDTPDPIYPGDAITFSVDWSDPDSGEQIKIHICKTNTISGQTCTGGSWCDSSVFTTADPAACSYTTTSGDLGTNNYYAFVCDDDNACSPLCPAGDSTCSGTFTVSWCVPPASGNWEIPVYCTLTNKNYTVNGNLIIRGTLDLQGTTNITFVGSPRYIYIYSGGNLYLADTAGFNK